MQTYIGVMSTVARVFSHSMRRVPPLLPLSNAMVKFSTGDAVVDAFNDPDFYLGGTNYKGYTVGLRYGLGINTWLRARRLFALNPC